MKLEVNNMRLKGKVKWFYNKKGYGFVVCEEVNEDIFIGYNNIYGKGFKTLKQGQTVSFDLEETEKGYCALNLVAEKIKL